MSNRNRLKKPATNDAVAAGSETLQPFDVDGLDGDRAAADWNPDRDQLIRQRAYSIWQAEGEPVGRDGDHWFQAEQEIAGAIEPDRTDDEHPRPA